MKYVTLGAGPSSTLGSIFGGDLYSNVNRDKDKMIDIKKEMIHVQIQSSWVVRSLIVAEANYRRNQKIYKLDYEFTPTNISNGYNSNSFTSGLLNASGVLIPKKPTYSVPGWNKPLPEKYFD